MAANVNIYVA